MKFIVGIILVAFLSTCRAPAGKQIMRKDWCSLDCPNERHIGCRYNGDCTLDPPCRLGKIDPEKILDIHNELRSKFASGKEADGTQAADMMALEWDDDLAFLALCNMKECPPKSTHDSCHITSVFDTAGQNIAHSGNVKDCTKSAYQLAAAWYNEIKYLTDEELRSFGEGYRFDQRVGHFTQLVWSRTTHIGCVLMERDTEYRGYYECMLVCNYAPGGNVLGAKMFKNGKTCSKCPKGRPCTSRFRGLCGQKVEPVKTKQSNSQGRRSINNIILFTSLLHSVKYFLKYTCSLSF